MEASTQEDPLGDLTAFADLADPRDSARCCYPLQELLLVALAGVASGADDWVDVAYWGRVKLEWLRRWLPFEHGITSHDTFNRVFALLDAQQFEACFMRWMKPLCPTLEGAVLAIDGKSVRGSRSGEQAMVHLVSLCETASGLTLAQCRTPAKRNEITAVPLLLDMLDVRGATISIDAIGCQREIADKVVECGADFILSAKNNQPNLAQAVQTPFDHSVRDVALGQLQEHTTIDQGHARRDTRRCVVTHDLSAMGDAVRELWPAVRSAIMIESTREFLSGKHKGQTSTERRYYISSATLEAEEFNRRIRAHWQIENQCHWLLDVVFHEHDARLHVGHGTHNFAILRRIVLNLIKKEKSTKASVKHKHKHKRASWSPDYLEILFGLTPALP